MEGIVRVVNVVLYYAQVVSICIFPEARDDTATKAEQRDLTSVVGNDECMHRLVTGIKPSNLELHKLSP